VLRREEEARRQPSLDWRRKPGPAPPDSPEEAHQPLKPFKGGVATSTVLWLVQ
ncbi:Hypothetical predicted protein, partial [Marmota monax]